MHQIIIHPGMVEAPRVFKRAETICIKNGYTVRYHTCLRPEAQDYKSQPDDVHIAHSASYICPVLKDAGQRHVFLVAPCTNQSHVVAFFRKFWGDIKNSFIQGEWSMFWYKHFSAIGELLFNYSYWHKMQKAFMRTRPSLPSSSLVVLYTNDPWNDGYDWSKRETITLTGQHDEIVYRPEATMQAIFDKLKS